MILNNVIMGSGENLDAEFATQDDLIAKIVTALQGKTTGTTVETCTIELNNPYSQLYTYTNENMELMESDGTAGIETLTVLKNTIMRCHGKVESCSGGISYQEAIWGGDVYISIIFVTGDGSLTITDDYII